MSGNPKSTGTVSLTGESYPVSGNIEFSKRSIEVESNKKKSIDNLQVDNLIQDGQLQTVTSNAGEQELVKSQHQPIGQKAQELVQQKSYKKGEIISQQQPNEVTSCKLLDPSSIQCNSKLINTMVTH